MREKSKRAITDMVQIGLMDALHGAKTMTVPTNVVLMANMRDHMGMIVHLTAHKTKQRWEVSASPSHDHRKSRTPEC